MFRKEFVSVVTNTGMMTLKELRPYTIDKDEDTVGELDLLKAKDFDEKKFAQVVAKQYDLQFIDLINAKISDKVLGLYKKNLLMRFRLVPIQKTDTSVTFATYDPSIKNLLTDLRTAFRTNAEIIITTLSAWEKIYDNIPESLDDLIESLKEISGNQSQSAENIKEEDIGEDVISFVNKILAEAFIKKASDIHVEPYETVFRVRFRIDGSLFKVTEPPLQLMLPVISRLKIMAQMDISEKRKPQDGRIKLQIKGKPIDYRVSSLPTLFGEKMVLRLLDQSNLQLDMTKLGFEPKQLAVFKEGIYKPYGMCLVTGPTGSGKTTTLYSGLSELNQISSNISTAEDPVEFNLEGINQVNVKKDIGLDFAAALKSFLRQDPDIIMVGEIRDQEVGEIAVEAALTGHMVLSTLHTNDAASTITRMVQMGIEPFLLTAALNVVVAQRLCRRICEYCKEEDKNISQEMLIKAGISPNSVSKVKVLKGVGCKRCNKTGYKGRVAIYEVLNVTPGIREQIVKEATTDELKKQAIKEGMKTLRMTALTKMALGQTSFEEALANSSSD